MGSGACSPGAGAGAGRGGQGPAAGSAGPAWLLGKHSTVRGQPGSCPSLPHQWQLKGRDLRLRPAGPVTSWEIKRQLQAQAGSLELSMWKDHCIEPNQCAQSYPRGPVGLATVAEVSGVSCLPCAILSCSVVSNSLLPHVL